ncbi:MAG: phage replisome organizer N-terminal domain-containing protein [Eubacteriales bacterium]|nr:phage replisome organizer N-terminal domain-containing protein [Eubacteriales bacterium]
MANIQWVKLSVDMFDNKKIKHLRRLPDGDSIVLIWVMLLTMAGRCNANGLIFLTENIPYSPKMLADELGIEENTVKLALSTFEQLNMIELNDGFIMLPGWSEHQNIEGMEKIREQNRLRKQKQRENQKLLSASNGSNVTGRVMSRDSHGTDKEIELEKDIYSFNADKPQKKSKTFVPPTLEEVTQYISEKKLSVDPQSFIDYFEAADWHDSIGQPVRNWKQKLLTWNKGSFGTGYKAPVPVEPQEVKGVVHL